MRSHAAAAVLALALFAGGCSVSGSEGVKADAPLAIYLSVPLSGAQADQGKAIEAQVRRALAAAGGKAGEHPIDLHVLDSTGGGEDVAPAAVGANARAATEDADTVAYIGELGAASATSLPITDGAKIAQIVLGPVPEGIDVDNVAILPEGAKEPGAAAVELLLPAIDRAADGASRDDVRKELRP